MKLAKFMKRGFRLIRHPSHIWAGILRRRQNILKDGKRAVSRRFNHAGLPAVKKEFRDTTQGASCFKNEILASQLFGEYPWILPILEQGPNWFIVPALPDETRLDIIAPTLRYSTRLEIAKQAMTALFDLFCQGYAHRDFHAKNLFWFREQLIITDFEHLTQYPLDKRPAFPESYDVTGKGLKSPANTNHMGYTTGAAHSTTLEQVLGISVSEALNELKRSIKDNLRIETKSFKSGERYHICKTGKVYASFNLPYLSVSIEEAQRNSELRIEQMGISEETVSGKTLLDLGCNVGGMLFQSQHFKPRYCLGIEYDEGKVRLAERVAAYNGLNNFQFLQGDIENISFESFGEPFDVVYCLAIEGHIQNKENLYRFLAQITSEVLYFEGNSNTDPITSQKEFLKNGFVSAEIIGTSQDDFVEKNNCRPLLIAKKFLTY